MSPLERIAAALPADTYEVVEPRDGTPCVEVPKESLPDLMRCLRDECGFEMNTFVTAIDRTPREPRFELDYQFLSLEHNDRVRVRTRVGDGESVPSITALWPGTSFSERECFDMFGIRFDGHPNLKRLLMPEAYEHFPLRKDFPHQGLEPDRLYREWERSRS